MINIVPIEALRALAAESVPAPIVRECDADATFRDLTTGKAIGEFDLDQWLVDYNVPVVRREPWQGGVKWILGVCPFNPEHMGPNKAIVGRLANGAIFAMCQHASCAGKGWREMREKYEPGWREKADSIEPIESSNDPHRLARNFVDEEWSHPYGPTLRYSKGLWYSWQGFVFREVPGDELDSWLNDSIKRQFDRESIEAQRRRDDKRAVARQVTNGLVSNVRSALRGQVLVPSSLGRPCWLGGMGPWEATDVLPAPNGLFHIPSLIDGTDNHVEPTPLYFSTFALDYPITLDAQPPVTWLTFLSQTWANDPQCISTLQEFMGYVLTQDTSQHKMLTLIGPPRSGKGVISRVTKGLIGSENVAGATFTSLRGSFGLEDLIDKALVIIPDGRLRGQTGTVMERLLSITGEDVLTVERKHKASINVTLPSRILLNSNELPRFDDASGALVSRMILLRMTVSHLGREDTTLTQRCLAERAGILLWALAGLRRLRERGHFIQPESANELLNDLEDLSSPVKEFVRDCCVLGPFREVSRADLYETYVDWCERTGRRFPDAPNTFGRNLRAAFPNLSTAQPRKGDERPRYYVGIALASP